MKLGYPCLNLSLKCTSAGTFRLANYSHQRVQEVGGKNLDCLEEMLQFNLEHNLMFFRIAANIIPFASHPVMDFAWQDYFAERLQRIGAFIREHDMRISIHAHAAVWLNTPNEATYLNSSRELAYNAQLLDLMGLDTTHKVQIHAGSFFNDREAAMKRFPERFTSLPELVQRRLVIENDERFFSLQDCQELYEMTAVPILFDTLHHAIHNNGESYRQAMIACASTWNGDDGIPMIDFSSQNAEKRIGAHAETLDASEFKRFLQETEGLDYDVMFEIKDKETSALKAAEAAVRYPRFSLSV